MSSRRLSLTKSQRQSAAGAELLSLCQTITEDGTISEEEVAALREWLNENTASELPAQKLLAETVERIIADGKVTPEERDELFHAVEAVLPPDVRETARSKHRSLDAAERLAAREERVRQRPVGEWDFMVAGVSHEGRAAVVERHAVAGQRAFVVRDRANRFSRNAVEVRLENGMCVGYVPEEYAVEMAPYLDDGCLHTAVVKKILGRRNIPVIVAVLYRPEAEVPGLVAEAAVPKTAATAGCSGVAALVVAGFVALAALALGCATAAPPELLQGFAPERAAYVVAMSVPQADAYRLTVAAFASQGVTVGAGDAAGGWLASSPMPFDNPFGTSLVRYRAIVMPASGGSEVALSLTHTFTASRALVASPTPTAERTLMPANNDFWWQLQRIATWLRYRSTAAAPAP